MSFYNLSFTKYCVLGKHPIQVLQKTAKVEDPESLSTAASAVEATVRDMVTNYFPLNSREYQRNADEYSTYLILLEGLFHALERSAPSMRLLGALHSTLRVEDHREALRLRDFVRRFVRHVLATQGGMATFKALLQLFVDPSLDDRLKDNIRFGIMEKLALPLLWDLVTSPMSCKDCWVTHWQLLLQYADPDISFANLRMRDVDALNLKVQEMACVYGMIEILFIRTPAELLKEQIVPELGGSSPSRDAWSWDYGKWTPQAPISQWPQWRPFWLVTTGLLLKYWAAWGWDTFPMSQNDLTKYCLSKGMYGGIFPTWQTSQFISAQMNSGGSSMSLNQNMMIFRYFQMFFVVTLPCHKACCHCTGFQQTSQGHHPDCQAGPQETHRVGTSGSQGPPSLSVANLWSFIRCGLCDPNEARDVFGLALWEGSMGWDYGRTLGVLVLDLMELWSFAFFHGTK